MSLQTRRLLQSSSLYLIANLASRAVGFVMIPLYSRFLTPAEYGLVELIELTVQVAALCIGLQSIGGAMIRIYHESKDDRWRAETVSTALWGGLAGNLLLVFAGLLGAGPISTYILHSPGNELVVRISVLAMLFSNLAEVHLIYFRLRDWVERCVVYSLVQLFASVGLNIYFIAVLGLGVKGFVLSKLVVSGVGLLYLGSRTLRNVGLRWNATAARKMLSFGSPLILSNLAFFLIHFGDRWFLSAMRTMTEVGNYSLAYRFAFVVSLLVGEPFGKVWNVTLYNYTSKENWPADFARVARYLTFALCFVALGLSIFGDDVVSRMATPAYRAAGALIPILVTAYVAREIGDFFRNALYINKNSRLVGRIALLSAVFNTVLNLALIRNFGMYGAAWATWLTWFLYLGLCWMAAHREHAIPFSVRPFMLAAFSGVALYGLVNSVPGMHPMLHLGLKLACLVQFVVALWLLSYFPAHERNAIKNRAQELRTTLALWVRQHGLGRQSA